MKRATRLVLVIAALAIAPVTRAEAVPITIASGGSQSFAIEWSLLVGSTELSALGNFTVSVTDSAVNFLVTLTNETAYFNERIHSMGLNTAPNATSVTPTLLGDYFDNFNLAQTFPGFQTIDLCTWTQNNCAGGRQGANMPGFGGSDTFGFRLNGDFTNGVALDTFVIKFQGDLGSYEVEGRRVPEPSTLLLLALGFAGTAATRYRRKQ